ncbi:MAG: PEP-CTERM sorting domain-containing protein [Verrucomicrobiales bacterium]
MAAIAGIFGLAFAQALDAATLFTDDFDSAPVDAGLGYSYWDARNSDPTAWSSTGSWWYNSSYDSGRRPTPRSGTQALHGGGDYNWVILTDTFAANTKYTFSMWTQGDSDSTGDAGAGTDSVWAYLFIGDAAGINVDGRPGADGNFDANSLYGVQFAADGFTAETVNVGGGEINAFSGFDRSGDSSWKEASISFTTGDASDPAVGKPIGLGFFGRADAAIDDVTFSATAVPEPSATLLSALGGMLLLGFRRSRRSE